MDNIKLVAMDLDHTLLNDDKKISKHTEDVLREAIRRGVYIVPATGRIFKSIPDFLKNIEGVRYALCCNGATVYDRYKDEIIYTNHLAKETVFEIFDVLEKYHCTHDIYQNGQGYMEPRFLDHLPEYGVKAHTFDLVKATRLPVEDLRDYICNNPLGIEKISSFFDNMEDRRAAFDELRDRNIASVSSSLSNNIEINQFGCDKGDGLTHLAEHLGIPMSQVMACGDASNDTKMIEAAGIGVVMENGMEELKEIADFVTKTNNQDGVAYAIEKLVLKDESVLENGI